MTNNPEVIVKCRWRSGGPVSSAVGSWQSIGGGSRGKSPEKFWSFYMINSLK